MKNVEKIICIKLNKCFDNQITVTGIDTSKNLITELPLVIEMIFYTIFSLFVKSMQTIFY